MFTTATNLIGNTIIGYIDRPHPNSMSDHLVQYYWYNMRDIYGATLPFPLSFERNTIIE